MYLQCSSKEIYVNSSCVPTPTSHCVILRASRCLGTRKCVEDYFAKSKALDSLETRFRNMKPLKNLPINYTVFKDGEKHHLHLGPIGDVRLLRLTLKGMSYVSIRHTRCQSLSFCTEIENCNFLGRETWYKIVKPINNWLFGKYSKVIHQGHYEEVLVGIALVIV